MAAQHLRPSYRLVSIFAFVLEYVHCWKNLIVCFIDERSLVFMRVNFFVVLKNICMKRFASHLYWKVSVFTFNRTCYYILLFCISEDWRLWICWHYFLPLWHWSSSSYFASCSSCSLMTTVGSSEEPIRRRLRWYLGHKLYLFLGTYWNLTFHGIVCTHFVY